MPNLNPRDTSGWNLARFLLHLVPRDAWLPVLRGPLRGMRWVIGSSTYGQWWGSYEQNKRSVFAEAIREGDCVYDVGAQAGFYTLLASRLIGHRGRVIAFEPNPRNVRYLRRHVSLNGLVNVRVVERAVAQDFATGRFDPGPHPAMGRLTPSGPLAVEVTSLDRFIEQSDVCFPDVIKIDVEGGEREVLLGARELLARRRTSFLVATHSADLYASCTRLLEQAGYEVIEIEGSPDELVAHPRPAEP